MKSTYLPALLVGVLTMAGVTTATADAVPAPPPASTATAHVHDVCGPAEPGHVRCFAEVRTNVHGGPVAHGLPAGYGPADLQAAYSLPSTGGAGQTVGIVDVGDDPDAENDLATYRSTYGLAACTTANGCFRKLNQTGKTSPLPADQGWGGEIALDLDLVSAACPACHIVLVESDDSSLGSLATAENTAVAAGANEVSNSYGGVETNGIQDYAAAYRHPGVAIVASTGDSGYRIPHAPAVYPSVIAVGGTSLTRASNSRGWTETAWGLAGSGCSAWIAKPNWQHDQNCPGRMIADVAADADPDTGPAVYDGHEGLGWTIMGGTSVSAPFIAGTIGLAGNPGRYPDASWFYTHASQLNDVTSGPSTGVFADCGGDYQCNAAPGYDGPTGNGTPNGIAAF